MTQTVMVTSYVRIHECSMYYTTHILSSYQFESFKLHQSVSV